ncbi:MAG: amidohydrolase [Candidatus Dormibacteraeota bacterium]|uniref:Amidohydrolase n=1 Tax=Candidatus Aeolococcus gillhamiae TaxID=3127015 RepID=A0A934MZ01_9BACT|nr:amidohydrolase [Candidatus Dormibacteraeota bacterium]
MTPRREDARRPTLFAGCVPEVAVGADGRIAATGPAARAAAGRDADVLTLRGRAHPGLGDAHLHLEWLARSALGADLTGAGTRREALARVSDFGRRRPQAPWITGSGWCNDDWSDDAGALTRGELDGMAGGRPVLLTRKDGHSACLSSAALAAVPITRETPDLPGGVVDRDSAGEPTGMVREEACNLAQRAVPPPGDADLDTALLTVLQRLTQAGLTAVHAMDQPGLFRSLQRLHQARGLPLRVVWNLPVAELAAAEALGVTSGLGDDWLRVWGVKAFLDGSLGSRTAEMLDGSGVVVTPQEDLVDIVRRCAAGHLNVCLHAIGDGAVRRALDALEPLRGAWRLWRPRVEHAQCVDPADIPRFASIGVIASMQPAHAIADRAVADVEWPGRTTSAYAWGALERSGARLAFGSDAPVEDPSPLLGIEAATTWRSRADWHPELALTRASALRAYSRGVAYAAGMEADLGALRAGMLCDLTLIEDNAVTATIVDGHVAWSSLST